MLTLFNREKINWSKITFNDNQECLDLIEKRPLGILSLLDEECKFPKATDLTFLEKLHTNHEKHPYYEKPRLTKTNFVIKHYAGEVSYECKGYLDKNKDTLQDDLLDVLISSKDKFISNMFSGMVSSSPTTALPIHVLHTTHCTHLVRACRDNRVSYLQKALGSPM